MSAVQVQITRREPAAAPTVASPKSRTAEPAGIVITTVDQISAGNQRGCGDDNPYN
ncbi:hypothetical protein Ait01nite_019870 [Actinoplanes italicus]|uniref:Uncharacterized protein n=1 Tax=Actinoplanes italicus TaxID=113567 RepID=A0A2T0KPE0_9ACTN|nr:hypothetical protein [Actinoplanes italicus]PRX25612.1 hypothetical protein CLV67_101329 [Actinoplanes italicus]GIE28942.1 hypothetical protein Ait01nite_019870 [Actinoplanes italicus]